MSKQPEQRRRELAKIHIARQALDIDEDTYRDILWTLGRVRSATDLDAHGRGQVLAHFRALGWRSKRGRGTYPGRPANVDGNDQLRKIEALLADMHLPWSYADKLAQQMYQVPKIAWVRETEQLQGVIVALTKKQRQEANNARA